MAQPICGTDGADRQVWLLWLYGFQYPRDFLRLVVRGGLCGVSHSRRIFGAALLPPLAVSLEEKQLVPSPVPLRDPLSAVSVQRRNEPLDPADSIRSPLRPLPYSDLL